MKPHSMDVKGILPHPSAIDSSARSGPTPDAHVVRLLDQSRTVDLSVVIPVYNSAEIMPALLARLTKVLGGQDMTYEIVMVEDGSPDDSWRVLSSLQRQDPQHIVAVQLMRNYGQHNALMCGFRIARGELIVTMDDDLQHPPEEIPKLIDTIVAGELDLVYGQYDKKKHPLLKNAGSLVVNKFFRHVFRLPVTVTAFRVIRRDLLDAILSYTRPFTFIDGLLAWNTRRVGATLVEHHPRAAGRSGDSLAKMVTLALNLFTNFSLLPLQLVSACGLLAAAGGFAGGLYYLVRFAMSGITVPGYASMILATLVLGGTQLLALGVIGEYVGRLHLNVNRKPQYSLRSKLSGSGAASPPESGNLGAKRGVIHAATSAPSQASIPFPAAFGRGAMGRGQAEVVREIFRK
jgi:polyisoprenyl-phosphate glycosyltransferase